MYGFDMSAKSRFKAVFFHHDARQAYLLLGLRRFVTSGCADA
jgi:hypothetical protein